MHISTMLVFWSLISLIRNSVVLAVYLLFSVAASLPYMSIYTGKDADHLTLTAELAIPCKPCAREIARQDFSLPVHEVIGAFRLIAHRYEKMPQWCCYKGTTAVFTMADNIIVTPEP